MATTTTKLGLTKPDFVDVVDISELNTNADEIDAAVGFTVCTNATRPASPYTGQSIFETDTGDSFIWDGSAWQPGGGGGSIEISATAPSSPAAGDLWWDSDNGNLYIYYTDVDSSQWVAANGPQVFVGTAAPAGYQGQMWFDSSTGKMYVYYDDGSSAQWVSAIGGSLAGSILQVVSTTKTDTFTASVSPGGTSADVTGLVATITPRSATSKILVTISLTGSVELGRGLYTTIYRDGSPSIARGDAFTLAQRVTSAGTGLSQGDINHINISSTYLDSPATTSATTYSVRLGHDSGGAKNVYVNRDQFGTSDQTLARSSSQITVMEVAG